MFRTYDNNFQIGPLDNKTRCLEPNRTIKEVLSDTVAAVHVGPPLWRQDDPAYQGLRP
jgi:hypothetical protein